MVCALAVIAAAARYAAALMQGLLITRENAYWVFTANTHNDPPAGTLANRSSPENSE
jgi:hypothetical protein